MAAVKGYGGGKFSGLRLVRKRFDKVSCQPLGRAFYNKRIHAVITAAYYTPQAARPEFQVAVKTVFQFLFLRRTRLKTGKQFLHLGAKAVITLP